MTSMSRNIQETNLVDSHHPEEAHQEAAPPEVVPEEDLRDAGIPADLLLILPRPEMAEALLRAEAETVLMNLITQEMNSVDLFHQTEALQADLLQAGDLQTEEVPVEVALTILLEETPQEGHLPTLHLEEAHPEIRQAQDAAVLAAEATAGIPAEAAAEAEAQAIVAEVAEEATKHSIQRLAAYAAGF